MFLKLRPFIFSLIFLAGLELVALRQEMAISILVFFLFLSLYEGKKIGGKFVFSILPIFFSISSVALLYLISIAYEKQIFIFLSSFIYYLSLFSAYRLGKYKKDLTAKGMNMAATCATIFFAYTSSYGLYLNFLVPLYYLMFFYMLITLLVSFQHFYIIEKDKKRIWIYSFLLSLIMVELIWTMNFWPFGYLTTGVIALILYYILWDLTQSLFLNLLSRKRVIANMVFFSSLIAMVLLSSKWLPIV